MRDANLSLYLVTDRSMLKNHELEDLVRIAAKNGVTAVQLREKDAPIRTFIQLAESLKTVLKPFGIPLIINDRVDVALAAGADGVHLGQKDMPVSYARKLLGPDKIVGLSVELPEELEEAEQADADYLGISPVFSTPTKTDTVSEWGIDGVKKVAAKTRHKLVGIGGLNTSNAGDVIRAGAAGVAVVSAICASVNPQKAASELREIIDRAGMERIS